MNECSAALMIPYSMGIQLLYKFYDVSMHNLSLPGDSVSTVEYYDPFVERWQLASSMCTLRSRVGIAVFKGTFLTRDWYWMI